MERLYLGSGGVGRGGGPARPDARPSDQHGLASGGAPLLWSHRGGTRPASRAAEPTHIDSDDRLIFRHLSEESIKFPEKTLDKYVPRYVYYIQIGQGEKR